MTAYTNHIIINLYIRNRITTMKPFTIIIILFVVFGFSCRKPEDLPTPSSIIRDRNWKLVEYNFNGTNITNNFSNCTFRFDGDGVLKITNAGQTYTGTWKEFSEPPKIELIVLANNTFINLFNRAWDTKLLNPQRIELADDKFRPQEIIKLDLIP